MSDDKKQTGGCQCGGVRYEVSGSPMLSVKCHCTDCQKSTGAGHMMGAAYLAGQFSMSGETSSYSYQADSGGTVTSEFCKTCASTVISRSTSYPKMVMVRIGTLDEAMDFKPTIQVFAKHKRSWDKDWPDVPSFDAMAPAPGK